jgi:hypothetical protein
MLTEKKKGGEGKTEVAAALEGEKGGAARVSRRASVGIKGEENMWGGGCGGQRRGLHAPLVLVTWKGEDDRGGGAKGYAGRCCWAGPEEKGS